MITRIIIVVFAVISFVFPASSIAANNYRTQGHWRDTNRDGIKDTYVKPHYRTTPDYTPKNNYGYPGNYNPNTGKVTPGNPYNNNYERRNKRGW